MNIVLLNTSTIALSTDRLQRVDPHLRVGVAVIAACLRRAGHAVRILDPRVENLSVGPFADRILAEKPDLVGFSAFTEEIEDAAAIAAQIKRGRPETRTVVGGYHASAVPGGTMEEFPMFDLAVAGEGEMPMLELASGVASRDIAGLAWRDGSAGIQVNPVRQEFPPFDELPDPAWDLYDLSRYGFRLPVEASRTCPFRCSFCFQATAPKTRFKAPEKVVDECEEGVRRHGAREISFGSAGAFPLNHAHGMAVCEGLLARGLKTPWLTTTRADVLNRELLRAMRASGCCYVSLGIETGDQEILSRCNKGLNLEQAEETIRLIHEAGIESELCFIIGLPGETVASLRKTRRFAMAMRRYATMASFAILTPFPGTEVFRMAECGEQSLGLATRAWRQFSKQSGFALRHETLTPRQLKRWQALLYLEFYFGSPAKALSVLTSKNMRELISVRRALALLGRML